MASKLENFTYNKRFFSKKRNQQQYEDVYVGDNEAKKSSNQDYSDWHIPEDKLNFDKEGFSMICTYNRRGTHFALSAISL